MKTARHQSKVIHQRNVGGKNNTLNRYVPKSACRLLLVLLPATFFPGCSIVDSFQPEVVRIEGGDITIKGWEHVDKSEFNVDIRLKPSSDNVTLHSVNLVCPDGKKRPPDSWKDETRRSSPPRLSFGVGLGIGGGREGHHSEGHSDGGSRTVLTPGVSVPLTKGGSKRTLTHVTARWKTDDQPKGADLSQCHLQVTLARAELDQVSLITLTLAMGYHQDEQKKDDTQGQDDKKATKGLIREIDFTQKPPVEIKSLEV